MRAKITAYNNNAASVAGCSDFTLSSYWGNNYKNVFYLCGDLGRSEFEDIIETETDLTGQTERTQNTTIERFNVSTLSITPLLQFLKTIDKHDVKTITFLDTNDTFNIKNIDIDDTGDTLTPTNLVYIKFEDEAITNTTPAVFTLDTQKLGYWDNNDDGTADINGRAQYTAGSTYLFETWPLLFEADGTTPATTGDVNLYVYAITQSGVSNLIGFFSGTFGDNYNDSSKWQNNQNIWDYFNAADTVGHRNRCQFDKGAFAIANGYYSDELEDRAVKLRFDLTFNGSEPQSTTLELVYTVRGAFSSMGVQSATTSEYGLTTIGKNTINEKNTLSTIQDIRTPAAGGVSSLISSATLAASTTFTNRYVLGVAPAGEWFYEGTFTTAAGYLAENERGAYGADNFTLSLDDAAPITQNINILNYSLGPSPYLITFSWKYDRQTGGGGFPQIGDIPLAGDAEVKLNGSLVNNLPTITPATAQVLGTQSVTLTNTETNTVLLTLPTSGGFTIKTSFELQLKALY